VSASRVIEWTCNQTQLSETVEERSFDEVIG
jgi:hypothetical protein